MENVFSAENLSWSPGKLSPLGAIRMQNGVNFALYAPDLQKLSLALFLPDQSHPFAQIKLDPNQHCTDGIWHIFVDSVPLDGSYAYQIDQAFAFDPYAKELTRSKVWKDRKAPLLGKLPKEREFDWEGVRKPQYLIEELVIYEMHIRGFTKDPSSEVKNPGSFLAVIEKIPYLLDLGINAVELLPIFSFDETKSPQKHLCNYWGYGSEHFFFPMAPYGTPTEFKEMIKSLHRAGIEVILDVVYNHVSNPSFELFAKSVYFILENNGNHTNYTGCGNTLNTNDPKTTELILASLRYFATEMQVDGFRFDLASIFCRNCNGCLLENPPILEAICDDPHLQSAKLIAEPWDCGGLYQVGTFPRKDRFAQWNGTFRDSVRRFLKGDSGAAGDFARAVSATSYFQSINFVTAHDGFTLHDLVSYNSKHNKGNGEGGLDGSDWNTSWNCGEEGKTDNREINKLRLRQMKNFILALCFSAGTPMMLMGDEYGHTRSGNNNAYCQDNTLNYFLWDRIEKASELVSFWKQCIAYRKSCTILQKKGHFDEKTIDWHNPCWDLESHLVAYTLHDHDKDFFLCFNAHSVGADLSLPPQKNWKRLIDTALEDSEEIKLHDHYFLAPYSSLLILS